MPLLEGSHEFSLAQRPSVKKKKCSLKVSRLYVREIYLLIWGIGWRHGEQLRLSPKWRCWQTPLLLSPLSLLSQRDELGYCYLDGTRNGEEWS